MTERLKPEFKVFHADAYFVFGTNPTLELLLENDAYPFAHEAGVFIPSQNALYITSNQHKDQLTQRPKITICKIDLPISKESVQATCTEVQTDNIFMPNGGVNYKDGILFCAQGTLTAPSGLAYMPLNVSQDSKTGHLFHSSTLLLTSFHGRPFNSPNDVVVHSDGSIWFTDPIYGWEQGIRPRPRLPNQVYRFDPAAGDVRAMADGFGRPNGICFSPDERTCYVTDTDWIHGDGSREDMRVSNMYVLLEADPLTSQRLLPLVQTKIQSLTFRL
jgi:gluconolactonase